MNYAQQGRNPSKHIVSIGVVILLHVLIIWGLISGLARKVVQVIKAPIETKIIEEVKPPPPPPERIELPPPPKFVPPPPAYVPPPEIEVKVPPPPQQTITVTPTPPPPEPPPPVAPRVEIPPPAPPAPPPPAPLTAAIVCPSYVAVLKDAGYPREALRAGIDKGTVTLKLTIGGNGTIKNAEVVSSSNRLFNRGAMEAARAITCQGQGRDVEVMLPIDYRAQ
jgi:protein TonB